MLVGSATLPSAFRSTNGPTDTGGVIVTVADPVRPSLVAVIVALPAATATTSPAFETVATPVFDDDHAIVRPVTTAPEPSRSTAVACVDWPTDIVGADSVTVTDATGGGVTVTVAEPVRPSMVAVISVLPAATPVTVPSPLTDATELLALDQLGVFPEIVAPWASRAVAVAVVVCPTGIDADARATTTLATVGGGGGEGGPPSPPPQAAATSQVEAARANSMRRRMAGLQGRLAGQRPGKDIIRATRHIRRPPATPSLFPTRIGGLS